MKKIYLVLLLVVSIIVSGFSQEGTKESTNFTGKSGALVLPEKGDIAIGLDMIPFLNYLGNFGNNTVGNTYNPSFLSNNNTFLVKYFTTEETAIRVFFRTSMANNTNKQYVRDDAAFLADPLSNDVTIDSKQMINNQFVLGFGYEKRRGTNRLRGFYGADAFFLYNYQKDKFSYGNPFTATNTNPTNHDFGGNLFGNERMVSHDYGRAFGIGTDLFLGAEYFILPKICLGTEVSWGGAFVQDSQGAHTNQYWNGSELKEQVTLDSPGDRNVNFNLNNPSIGLYLMLHF